MRILAIETSCDETSIAIVEAEGELNSPSFHVVAETTASQLALHAEWGGVVPNLAKREHQRALVPTLLKTLNYANFKKDPQLGRPASKLGEIEKILERELDVLLEFNKELLNYSVPEIDAIAVTAGPGLEPALWVGVNFAKALACLWNKPLYPINHMEGHFLAAIAESGKSMPNLQFPMIGLLVSGGHTELIISKNIGKYQKIGATKDDAAGEAFDKVAIMLGRPYPGGPIIGKLAEEAREAKLPALEFKFPRPMIDSDDYNFSFSGLKTSVRYFLEKQKILGTDTGDENFIRKVAREFEDAVTEVLVTKTIRAAIQNDARIIIVGGGVSASKFLRKKLTETTAIETPETPVIFTTTKLSTDNGTMIAIAAYVRIKSGDLPHFDFSANGNLSL
ncbi:MAG: tRNA (adenosine(37)-N6)-threonylcarbamoyltransferase complex transferase subunit TsaD [Patescibacteria group bacterium]